MRKLARNFKTFVVLSKQHISSIYGFVYDVYRSEGDIFADALWVENLESQLFS